MGRWVLAFGCRGLLCWLWGGGGAGFILIVDTLQLPECAATRVYVLCVCVRACCRCAYFRSRSSRLCLSPLAESLRQSAVFGGLCAYFVLFRLPLI